MRVPSTPVPQSFGHRRPDLHERDCSLMRIAYLKAESRHYSRKSDGRVSKVRWCVWPKCQVPQLTTLQLALHGLYYRLW